MEKTKKNKQTVVFPLHHCPAGHEIGSIVPWGQ